MRALLLVGVAVVVCGCVPKPAEPPAQRKLEDGVPVREVVELYRANPAKALAAYEDKFTKMTGIVPLKIVPSPHRTKVFEVLCSCGDGKEQSDMQISCLQDETANLEVGKACSMSLSLFNNASPTGRPYFFTRNRMEGDTGEKRAD